MHSPRLDAPGAGRSPANAITRRLPAGAGVLLMGLLLVACSGADPAARAAVAERDALRRELTGLGELRALAARGVRADPAHAVVVVRDSLVQSILVAALPITVQPGQQLDVTLQRASVQFVANTTRVMVEGTVRHRGWPAIAASLSLRGALGEFRVDSGGSLGAQVKVDDVVLSSPSGVPEALGPAALSALQNLVDRALPEIERVLPAIAIPVRLDKEITLPGFSAGNALTVAAARAPLHVAVERVGSWNGRLWVVLLVRAGAFTRVTHAAADSTAVGDAEPAAAATDSAGRR
jgi:hypothetical protein